MSTVTCYVLREMFSRITIEECESDEVFTKLSAAGLAVGVNGRHLAGCQVFWRSGRSKTIGG